MKHLRQLFFSILLCLSVIASAQKTDLSVTVDPVDAITESTLTEARVSLLNPTDSTEVIRRVGRICHKNHDGHEGRHSGL